MNMRTTRLALILVIAGALILGACKRASPTPSAATATPTQSSATVTLRAKLPVRTLTPRPTLPGTTYPGPGQVTGVATQAPIQASTPAAASELTQVAYPAPATVAPSQDAYPAPGAGAPTQPGPYPGPYPGPGANYIPATPNPYPGPGAQLTATRPPATQPPATQPPATQLLRQPSVTPTPSLKTPAPALALATATANPIYNTFTPTPTFPSSFGDAQFHVTDPATVQLASGNYQLVEFFAYWCGTCRAMAPLLNGLEDQYKDQIRFVYLDIDNPATRPFKDALHFRVEPENYLLDGQGKVVKQWSGYVSREEFQAGFDAVVH